MGTASRPWCLPCQTQRRFVWLRFASDFPNHSPIIHHLNYLISLPNGHSQRKDEKPAVTMEGEDLLIHIKCPQPLDSSVQICTTFYLINLAASLYHFKEVLKVPTRRLPSVDKRHSQVAGNRSESGRKLNTGSTERIGFQTKQPAQALTHVWLLKTSRRKSFQMFNL